jgi:hypothetical protein
MGERNTCKVLVRREERERGKEIGINERMILK